MPSKRNRIF